MWTFWGFKISALAQRRVYVIEMQVYYRYMSELWKSTGADPGFQISGGALKIIAPSGARRENIWGYFVWKITILRKKNHIFSNFRGGAPPPGSAPGLEGSFESQDSKIEIEYMKFVRFGHSISETTHHEKASKSCTYYRQWNIFWKNFTQTVFASTTFELM